MSASLWTTLTGIGSGADDGLELGFQHELLAAGEPRLGLGRRAAHRELARLDPGLEPAARELGEQRGRGLIEPLAGQLGRHLDALRDTVHRITGATESRNFSLYCPIQLPNASAQSL